MMFSVCARVPLNHGLAGRVQARVDSFDCDSGLQCLFNEYPDEVVKMK